MQEKQRLQEAPSPRFPAAAPTSLPPCKHRPGAQHPCAAWQDQCWTLQQRCCPSFPKGGSGGWQHRWAHIWRAAAAGEQGTIFLQDQAHPPWKSQSRSILHLGRGWFLAPGDGLQRWMLGVPAPARCCSRSCGRCKRHFSLWNLRRRRRRNVGHFCDT